MGGFQYNNKMIKNIKPFLNKKFEGVNERSGCRAKH